MSMLPSSCARTQVAGLAQAGYRVLCPDLLGAGRSDKPQAVDEYKLGAIVKVGALPCPSPTNPHTHTLTPRTPTC